PSTRRGRARSRSASWATSPCSRTTTWPARPSGSARSAWSRRWWEARSSTKPSPVEVRPEDDRRLDAGLVDRLALELPVLAGPTVIEIPAPDSTERGLVPVRVRALDDRDRDNAARGGIEPEPHEAMGRRPVLDAHKAVPRQAQAVDAVDERVFGHG